MKPSSRSPVSGNTHTHTHPSLAGRPPAGGLQYGPRANCLSVFVHRKEHLEVMAR